MKNIRRTLGLLLSTVAIFSLTPTNVMAGKPDFAPGKPDFAPGKPEIIPPGKNKCIIHNGMEYCPVLSPHTGKVWLDRNLGAAQVCEVFDDVACYGDYYQWGRNFDGHEDSLSGTNSTQATDVNDVGHGDFIITHDDWAADGVDNDGSIRSANWQKTDGNSVCPVGYRVPIIGELEAELLSSGANIQNSDEAFKSFLNLPSAGIRIVDGSIVEEGKTGVVWSGTTVEDSQAHTLGFYTEAGTNPAEFVYGMSVRCLMD